MNTGRVDADRLVGAQTRPDVALPARRSSSAAERGHRLGGILGIAMLIVLAATGAAASDEAPGKPPAHEAASRERAQQEAAHEPGRVTIAPDVAARSGIATVRVEAAAGKTHVEAFGRVLDPLPLIDALGARDAATAAAVGARAEYARVQRLYQHDQNASARDLEAARIALVRAELDVAGAAARLSVAWGAGEVPETLADDLAHSRVAVVRIDLAAGDHLATVPPTVTVAALATPDDRVAARVVGRATTVDPNVQGEAYVALATDARLRPGAALTVTIESPDAPSLGVAVPAAALLWADGRAIVYAKVGTDAFERRAVALATALDDRTWLVTDGVAAGDEIVTRGAAQVLSAETLGAAETGGD